MADDFLSLIGKEGFNELTKAKKEVAELGKLVIDVNGKIKSIYDSLGKNASAKGFNKFSKEAEDLIKRLTDATKKYEQAKKAAADADLKASRAAKENAKANKDNADANFKNAKAADYAARMKERATKQSEKNTNAAQREQKALDQLSDEYAILSKAYNEAARRAKNYQLTLGETHPISVEATADAKALGAQLYKLDASVGQHTRNVGNYASANLELQYILRDLPSFANGVQTGLMGISNNISPLADKIEALRKTGMSNTQIFTDMAKSFMSFSGVLSLVVLGVTLFASSWEKLLVVSDNASKAQSKAIEGYIEEEIRLKSLQREVEDTATSQDRLKQIRDKLVSQYPALADNLEDEENLQYKLSNAINAVTGALRDRALMRAAEDVIVEETKKMLQGEIDTWDMVVTSFKAGIVGLPKAIADQGAKSAKEYEEMYSRMLTIIDGARERLRKSGFETFFDTEGGKGGSSKVVEETVKNLNIVLQAKQDADAGMLSVASETSTRLQQLSLEEAQRLRLLEESYSAGLMTYEEYQAGKVKIAETTTEAIIRLQIDELKAVLNTSDISADKRIELEKKVTELYAQLNKDRVKDNKQTDEEILKNKQENARLLQQQAYSLFNELAALGSVTFQREIADIDESKRALESKHKLQIAQINVTEKDEIKRREAIAEAELRYAQQSELLESKKRDAQQRQARFEKAASIASIIAKTAEAVISALKIPIVGTALAVSYGLIGAAQIARVAATPIPQYAEGTDSHKGGLAVVGDGGKREVVQTPDGQTFITPNKDTLIDLPAHSKVFPSVADYVGMVHGSMTPELIQRVSNMQNVTEKFAIHTDEVVRATSKVVDAIKGQKPVKLIGRDWSNYINGNL